MSIYRGPGGPGDAVNDSSSEASIVVLAKDAAIAAQVAAELAATEAEASAVDAAASAVEAAASATSVGDDADAAAASAAAAAASAAAAALDATDADASATTASSAASTATSAASTATTQASNASTSATNAATSETNAATSETNAASSASAASTSETNAASSATAASGSASAAATSASNASTSETNAAASATSASGSATTATTQAGIATTQATNAASSASAASTSATNAATSETNAASSASSAATSASSANSAADAALAALDSFDDRYLGQKATAPTLDNDGNALVTGALYFDTTTNTMKVWDGSTWLAAYASLSGALIATNNLSDVSSVSAARTNLGLGTAATTDSTAYATAAQGTNADTAYGWGDHAAAGYANEGVNTDITSMTGVTGGISSPDFVQIDTTGASTQAVGKIQWDDGNGTLEFGLKGGNVNLQVGQEIVARVYNDSGASLTDGQVVYISGSQGNRIAVKLANAVSEATSAGTLGMVTEPIASGAEGFITIMGTVNGLDTSALTAGSLVYLSATTAGAYTTTAPTAPNHRVILGYVERVHATVGSIYVKVDNGYELDELHNVVITSPTDGQLLTWEASSSTWTNKAAPVSLPSQTGHSGEYLTTDGTTASWAAVNVTPALDDLTDVVITSAATDEVLKYNGTAWVNSAPSGGGGSASNGIFQNATTVSANETISTGNNGWSVGPMTVASGVTVTVAAGQRWVVI